MGPVREVEQIHIGLVTEEPIRLAGLASIFEEWQGCTEVSLLPLTGTLDELLSSARLEYLVVDLASGLCGVQLLETIRGARPEIRLIVIGPDGNDELVIQSILAGARAYLDLSAGPDVVRKAVHVVTSGSIWAPRRLLSELVDRLLQFPDTSLANAASGLHLTDREQQVMELLLKAHSNREIARRLGIEERTVKAHLGRLMRKTGADNRIELSMRLVNQPLGNGSGFVERRQKERRGHPYGPSAGA